MQVAAAVKDSIIEYFNRLVGSESVSMADLNDYVKLSVPGLRMLSRTGNGFQEVTYTILEGSSSFTHQADKATGVKIETTQVATIGSIIINVEA
jgi:hypothetical protein